MEKVKLMNMCMIVDENSDKVLFQERRKSWKGLAFPGGKINTSESIVQSTIREVYEETGLTISQLQLCGIKNWYDKKNKERHLIFLYKTSSFTGTLLEETEEGSLVWESIKTVDQTKLASDFMDTIKIYEESVSELIYEEEPEGSWVTKFY